MFDGKFSNWDIVRGSLGKPPVNERFSVIGLSDKEIAETLEWEADKINDLADYGVDAHHPAAIELTQLMQRIAELAGITPILPKFSGAADLGGGKLTDEEENYLKDRLDSARFMLRSLLEKMSPHASTASTRHERLKSAITYNENREAHENNKHEALKKVEKIERRKLQAHEAGLQELYQRRELMIARLKINDGLSREDAELVLLERPFGTINLERAHEFKLEKIDIKGNEAAQELMMRIIDQDRDDSFDIVRVTEKKLITDGIILERFFAEWNAKVGDEIPVPGRKVLNRDYLRALQNHTIVKNIDVEHPEFVQPEFDKSKIIWMENWKIGGSLDDLDNIISPLQRALCIKDSEKKIAQRVYDASHENVDKALWVGGDPGSNKKTSKHILVLKKLGLNPELYTIRLLNADEYVRLDQEKFDSQYHAATLLNNYALVNGELWSIEGRNDSIEDFTTRRWSSLGFRRNTVRLAVTYEG